MRSYELSVRQIFVLTQLNDLIKSCCELRVDTEISLHPMVLRLQFIYFEACNPVFHGCIRRTLLAKGIQHIFIALLNVSPFQIQVLPQFLVFRHCFDIPFPNFTAQLLFGFLTSNFTLLISFVFVAMATQLFQCPWNRTRLTSDNTFLVTYNISLLTIFQRPMFILQ